MIKKIFVSSSGIKIRNLEHNISYLANNGIKNIELSGGCVYGTNILTKLKKLKKKYNLEFMVHNYFPPPKNNFVLNLGSCNDLHYNKTIEFYKKAIDLCREIGVKHYGMHAGFLIDLKTSELNNKIKKRDLYIRKDSIKKVIQGYGLLKKYSQGKVKLYLENNVITQKNLKEYGENPLLLTCYSDYLSLKKKFNFEILLDLAHLKVSAKTLKINFLAEVKKFQKNVKYAHVSGNNALRDLNKTILNDLQIQKGIKLLKNINLITLEVYEDINSIIESKNICEKLLMK